jgi:DNA-binding transcriptional LysR family regulator
MRATRDSVPQAPQDLEQHQALIYSGSSTGPWTIADANGKRFSPGLKPAIVANNGDFLLQMACAGHGLVMLPTFIFLVKLKHRPQHEAKVMCNDLETAAHIAILSARSKTGGEEVETLQFRGMK